MSRKIPRGEEHLICPYHKKSMADVCHTCPMWTEVRGTNPNTGADISDWNCSLAWMPILLMECAQQSRQGAAATESFRNEMVQLNILGMRSALNGAANTLDALPPDQATKRLT